MTKRFVSDSAVRRLVSRLWFAALCAATALLPARGRAQVSQTDTPRVCTAGGWCWENPQPQGEHINAIWGDDERDAWAVGESVVLHWNGDRWAAEQDVRSNLLAVGGTPTNVWTVGADGTVLHLSRGAGWEAMPPLPDRQGTDISGTARNDVWGADGANLFRWDGGRWNRVPVVHKGESLRLQSVWARLPDDVWAVGSCQGAVFSAHWNGKTWSISPTGLRLDDGRLRLSGNEASGVWLEAGRFLLHWQDDHWASLPERSGFTVVLGPRRVVSVDPYRIRIWSGASWMTIGPGPGVNPLTIWGTSADRLWASAGYGRMLRWDGRRWSDWPKATLRETTVALAGTRDDLWALGENATNGPGMLRRKADLWSQVTSPSRLLPEADRVNVELKALAVHAAADAWIVGGRGPAVIATQEGPDVHVPPVCFIAHWNGRRWTRKACPKGRQDQLRTIWAAARDDVWASGKEGLIHWNGRSWSRVPIKNGERITALAGTSSSDVWAALMPMSSCLPEFLHHGERWQTVESPSRLPSDCSGVLQVRAIWAHRPDLAWAVGSQGLVLRWDGKAWRAVVSGTKADLNAVTGTGDDDVWIVGQSGTILHWNGSKFSTPVDGPRDHLYSVWADHPEVMVGGYAGRILRWSRTSAQSPGSAPDKRP